MRKVGCLEAIDLRMVVNLQNHSNDDKSSYFVLTLRHRINDNDNGNCRKQQDTQGLQTPGKDNTTQTNTDSCNPYRNVHPL